MTPYYSTSFTHCATRALWLKRLTAYTDIGITIGGENYRAINRILKGDIGNLNCEDRKFTW